MELYFRQLKAGQDFGRGDRAATRMDNFIYLVGDREQRKAVVIDAAWDIPGILARLDEDGIELTGALASHYHPDHVGGDAYGLHVNGLADLMAARPVKVYANRNEIDGIELVTGLSRGDFTPVDSGDTLAVGETTIRFLHTPGHTPGSQCFLINGKSLAAGDTLFIDACGRVDLPGGNPQQMYESLTKRLAQLPDDVVLYPGHDYGRVRSDTLGAQRQTNPYLKAHNLKDWLRTRGV